jgi:hypothetical protein
MLIGGVLWLIGELIGVFSGSSTSNDTTSQWAHFIEKKFPIARVFIGIFLISLVGHILFGWWLLP